MKRRRHFVADRTVRSELIIVTSEKLSPRAAMYKAAGERDFSPQTQIEAMDKEGVDVTVLFPTRGLHAHARDYADDGLAEAISRAYNDWLSGYCSYKPDRLMGAAMLPPQNVEAAIREARRAKNELRFPAVFIRPNPIRGRNWHDPYYDPLWAECEKLGLTVGFHEGRSCELPVAVADRFVADQSIDTYLTEHVSCHPIEMMYACLSMIAGSVCHRFPALRIGFLEGNCSWTPFWLWRMDQHWEAAKGAKPPEPPSFYFRRQCWVSVEADEEVGSQAVNYLQGSNIVFSTDYPHTDSKFPHAVDTFFERSFPTDAKRNIYSLGRFETDGVHEVVVENVHGDVAWRIRRDQRHRRDGAA